jgi:hypothetical protein
VVRVPGRVRGLNGDEGAPRDARETEAGARERGDGAAGRSAARFSPARQKQAPATKSITLNASQIQGRERIGQLNLPYWPRQWPVKKGSNAVGPSGVAKGMK